jgi:hypothetical protein
LTITDFKAPVTEIANRKYICLSGRVHPGESPASYMMDGVISFLCGGSEVAKRLRKIAVFKIVPMLNPDGVATGNNRCNLAGHDLNRTWTAPSVSLSPTIYHWKQLISMQIERRNRSDARSDARSNDRSNDSSGLGGIVDYVSSSTLGNRNGVGGGSVPSSEGVSLFCDFHGKWCIGDFCCWFFLLLLAKSYFVELVFVILWFQPIHVRLTFSYMVASANIPRMPTVEYVWMNKPFRICCLPRTTTFPTKVLRSNGMGQNFHPGVRESLSENNVGS